MDINYYRQYEPIFGSWHITRQIGEGSFGKVFEIQREDFGTTYRAALKAITVPASEAELRDVMADGMDEEGVRTYFHTFVQDLVKEFALMSRLKGNSNIVSYENHQVIEHKDGIGWDILIQMELLTPLNEYTRTHTVTRQDIIRLGIDMCRALELCQKYNIIHRDVKPENMFVSENGDFKLGDFGIARTVEKTSSGLSKKGTYTYMAPEVYKGEPYGSTVDIYSLGIVLYRLLNGNRTPFLPAAPAPITHADRENALARRFSGASLPAPSHAEGRLAEIVLKACAYDPRERYSSPMQMRQELESILYSREEGQYIYPEGDDVPQDSVHYVKTGEEPPVSETEATQRDSEADVKNDSGAAECYDSTVSDFGGAESTFNDGTANNFERTVKKTGSTNDASKSRHPWPNRALLLIMFIAVLGLLLGFVYKLTKGPAAEPDRSEEMEVYAEIFPQADSFRELEDLKGAAVHLASGEYSMIEINGVSEALDVSGNILGHVFVLTTSEGFGGDIQLAAGIQSDNTILGISFLSISETEGRGMNADTEEWKAQFCGIQANKIIYTKTGKSADNEIDAISGATVTTEAVTDIVNAALSLADYYLG